MLNNFTCNSKQSGEKPYKIALKAVVVIGVVGVKVEAQQV